MLKKVNWVTFAIVLAMIGGLVLAVRAGMTPAEITAFASAGFAIASQLEKMFAPQGPTPPTPDDGPKPPPNLGGPAALLLVLVLARGTVACATLAAQQAEAESEYGAELVKCASTEPNRPAVDACKAGVRERWNVQDAGDAGTDGAK